MNKDALSALNPRSNFKQNTSLSAIPWASCLLSKMLILYLEKINKDTELDYHQILSNTDHLRAIPEPKAFLLDPNNWIPHLVLSNLIRSAEMVSGNKDIAYLAARGYFEANQTPSLLEIIAQLLNTFDQVIHFSGLWASGYTNYLKLQCFEPTTPKHREVIILSQFGAGVEPLMGNIDMVRGCYEGITRLFQEVGGTTCIEEISQVRLESLVKEFVDYKIEKDDFHISIIESASEKLVARAGRTYLKDEIIAISQDDSVNKKTQIVEPQDGKGSVLSLESEKDLKQLRQENSVFEIIQGGILNNGRIRQALRKGQRFNAPYSRYRLQWRFKGERAGSLETLRGKSQIVPLLFDHLYSLRETQRKQLLSTISNQALTTSNEQLKTSIQKEVSFFGIIGKNARMQALFEQIALIARSDVTVLITGETGTGKELFARAIHQSSLRCSQKFLAINCAALPGDLLEAELFGYEKGAFTGALTRKKGIFESVDGGTLFLDEVGDLSAAMQAKLLRVLENQEIRTIGGREMIPIDVRIISATNKDLEALVADGKFRSDLHYRINVILLSIPPFRERLDDLLILVDHYLDFFSRKSKKQKPVMTPVAVDLLKRYSWPGNVRQLKNVIERAIVLDRDSQITSEDIILPEDAKSLSVGKMGTPRPFHEAIEGYKRTLIEEILKETEGNQTKAAERLGLQRTYLSRLIRNLDIDARG